MRKIKNNPTLVSILLLILLAAIVFLPLINSFGFYRDDWHVVWGALTNGIDSVFDQHKIDRPFMGLIYSWLFYPLGYSPLAWNLFAVLTRVISVVIFFCIIKTIFPEKKKLPFYMSVVFFVYPGFLQLPNGNTYQNHLIGLDFGLLSLLLTLWVIKSEKIIQKLLWAGLSGFFAVCCYLMFEWMIGLEAVRFVLIFYCLFQQSKTGLITKFIRNYFAWIFNLGAVALFLVWRIFIFESYRSVTDVGALSQRYLSDLIPMLMRLLLEWGKDFLDTIVFAWFIPLYHALVDAQYTDILFSILVGLLAVGAVYLFVRLGKGDKDEFLLEEKPEWAIGFVIFGVLSVLGALLPAVMAEREVRYLDTLDRYTMTAMFGVAFLFIGLIARFIQPRFRIGLLCILVFFSTMTHYHNGLHFGNFWNMQKQLWWQLSWRAPAIEEETVLLVQLPSPWQLAEDYEIWGPANMIYYPGVSSLGILSDTFTQTTLQKMYAHEQDERNMRTVWLERDYENVLLVTLRGQDSCLHVIDPQSPESWLYEDALVSLAAPYSKPERILDEGQPQVSELIFGNEPQHGWCYYYQNAALESQRGNYDAVMQIWQDARYLQPAHISELFPFLEASLRVEQSDVTKVLLEQIRGAKEFANTYCSYLEYNQQESNPLIFEALCTQ